MIKKLLFLLGMLALLSVPTAQAKWFEVLKYPDNGIYLVTFPPTNTGPILVPIDMSNIDRQFSPMLHVCHYVSLDTYTQVQIPQNQIADYYNKQPITSMLDNQTITYSKKDIIPPNGLYMRYYEQSPLYTIHYNTLVVGSQGAQHWNSEGQWVWYNYCNPSVPYNNH